MTLQKFVFVPEASILREGGPICDLVEADNLDVLPQLPDSSIDCIYIDPPYNTGSSALEYSDRKTHAQWVDFVRSRLVHAARLLKDDGAMFVSIDDREQARLRLLCDEIFGEDNFVAQFIWHKTNRGKALSRVVRQVTEYVLCFAKNRKTLNRVGLFGSEKNLDSANPLGNRSNKRGELVFPPGQVKTNLDNGTHPAGFRGSREDTLSVEVIKPFEVQDGQIVSELSVFGRFRWVQETLNERIQQGTIFEIRKGKFRIVFYSDVGHKAPSSLLDSRCDVGTNESATKGIFEILGNTDILCLYSKPVSLVRYLLNSVVRDRKDAIVLDFFAGTGTTGQAVAELNEEDGGMRNCVLITNGEFRRYPRIAQQRLKVVFSGEAETGRKSPPGSLRVFERIPTST